jgi:hypothetical protein
MPKIEQYTVTATIVFTIAGSLTMGGAADEVSLRLNRVRDREPPVSEVLVTDLHIHREGSSARPRITGTRDL